MRQGQLHFFEGLLLNLAGAFTGDVVFVADFLKGFCNIFFKRLFPDLTDEFTGDVVSVADFLKGFCNIFFSIRTPYSSFKFDNVFFCLP